MEFGWWFGGDFGVGFVNGFDYQSFLDEFSGVFVGCGAGFLEVIGELRDALGSGFEKSLIDTGFDGGDVELGEGVCEGFVHPIWVLYIK